jgi:hypothetical protein
MDKLTRIAEAVRGLPAERALVDGEAVVFRPDGRSEGAAPLGVTAVTAAVLVAVTAFRLEGER